MSVKRLMILFVMLVAVAIMLTPGVAFANFAIHGGYAMDTDACAGCHRAHTSVSSITWTDNANPAIEHTALLVSNASLIYEFCYACHDNAGQGADTNVEGGIYEGTAYGTTGAPLNGGFFGDASNQNLAGQTLTSKHVMETVDWGAWGGYYMGAGSILATNGLDPVLSTELGTGNTITMTCVSCHDPHGSSNYRLLKDSVNGIPVGGYLGAAGDIPDPYVISDEPGYPNGTGGTVQGWLKHDMGNLQIGAYTPNYTTPMYAKAPTSSASPSAPDYNRGMSGWCIGCHNTYMQLGTPHEADTQYAAMDGWGLASRHRHPVNISLTDGVLGGGKGGYGPNRSLTMTLTLAPDIPLPLAHDAGTTPTNTANDWLDCLTCHVAHGTSVTMTGYANIADATNIEPNSGTGGVPPSGNNGALHQSSLLRLNNRGVCEVCHNK